MVVDDYPANSQSRTGLIVGVTAILTAMVLILGGLAVWLLMKGADHAGNENARIVNPSPSPAPSASPTPTASINANSANALANNTVADSNSTARSKREVTQFLANWKSAAESKNSDTLVDQYGENVAYYNRSSASRDEVLADKRRALSIYDRIRIDISDISTSIGSDGETAITTFDKEWEFLGNKNSRGKVRSELRLKKYDGKWRIVGEHDVRVYYVE
jgi:hypothetical protein